MSSYRDCQNEGGKSEDIAVVSCKVCREEIPLSEAKSVEGQDYVWYFCGLDCYEQWKHALSEQDNSWTSEK